MNPKLLKGLAIASLVVAALLGFVAYHMSSTLLHHDATAQASQTAAQAPKTRALVAVKPLQANQPIAKDAVKLVPVSVTPAHYFISSRDVVGKRPLVSVVVGTTLTPAIFQSAGTLSHHIPAGDVAMSLRIDDIIAVGGMIVPGDHVNVLVYVRNQGQQVKNAQARILLKDARVLALNGKQAMAPRKPSKAESREKLSHERHTRNVVLAVPQADTTRVMLGASVGKLRLALLPQPAQVATNTSEDTARTSVIAPQESNSVAKIAASKDAISSQKPITLRELTKLQENKDAPRHAGHHKQHVRRASVIVYRGDDVSRER